MLFSFSSSSSNSISFLRWRKLCVEIFNSFLEKFMIDVFCNSSEMFYLMNLKRGLIWLLSFLSTLNCDSIVLRWVWIWLNIVFKKRCNRELIEKIFIVNARKRFSREKVKLSATVYTQIKLKKFKTWALVFVVSVNVKLLSLQHYVNSWQNR